MIKIGITSGTYKTDNRFNIDFAKYVERGYESLDFSDFFSSKSRVYKMSEEEFNDYFISLKKELDKYGLFVNQTHALWDTECEEKDRENLPTYYIKAIKACALMKCPHLVCHPISPISWSKEFTTEEIYNANIKFFTNLLPYLKEYDVKIAIENLPFLSHPDFFSPMGTLKLINDLKDEHFVMCLDTGHLNMFRNDNQYEDIIKIGDKLRVLHLHDNNSWTDSHNFPFMGNVKWYDIIKGLKDINFKGVLSLETNASSELPKDIYEAQDNTLNITIKYLQSLMNE